VSKQLSKNFDEDEFRCQDKSAGHNEWYFCGGIAVVHPELVEKLQLLRDEVGRPVKITSGYRCPAYNTVIGGVVNSQHKLGRAADVYVAGMTPGEVAEVAEEIGFRGIGVYASRNFTHLDVRDGPIARWNG